MGNIASPWRYDAEACSSLQSSRLRRPAMLHSAFSADRFTSIGALDRGRHPQPFTKTDLLEVARCNRRLEFRPTAVPRLRPFKLRRKAEQSRLVAEAADELGANGQSGGAPREKKVDP